MSNLILFKEIYFILSFSTQKGNAYNAGNLINEKTEKNEPCL